MLLSRRIENRHILWTALSMVAIGLIVPGGFGVKPPQWFLDRPQQGVASVPSVEQDTANTSTCLPYLVQQMAQTQHLAAGGQETIAAV